MAFRRARAASDAACCAAVFIPDNAKSKLRIRSTAAAADEDDDDDDGDDDEEDDGVEEEAEGSHIFFTKPGPL